MKNKCETCGYRFRSDDETICPECLSARDTDVNCDNLHSHEENTSFINNNKPQYNQPQYNYGYGQTTPQKRGKSGCLITIIIIVAVVILFVVFMVIAALADDMDSGLSREESSNTVNASYNTDIRIKDLTFSYSKPYAVSSEEIPSQYPLREGYKMWAVDVVISEPENNYTSFDNYGMRLATDETPVDDYSPTDWSAISYNGLFDEQAPGYIKIIPETVIEKTMYYEIPMEYEMPYLTVESSDYFDDKIIKTLYKFS